MPYSSWALVILYLTIKQIRRKSLKGKSDLLPFLPGPAPWPVVGCALDMLRNKPTGRWILRLMEEMNTDIACFHIGTPHIIPITNPKIAQEFLKNQDATFVSRPISMAAWVFNGGYTTTVMRQVLMTEIICPTRHNWLYD
ncbi:hypothetical protein EUGRSUZ_L01579 [Eucalyptus grandis]|uniref:Uncharacterized protein n=1 Tax=Eucalyptus grandis TaxID=71139 RepID=A0A058ZSR2_EUCGR|nr:hypothetical protein EUGRSUZ_L01579 [Eucalyptus grandis]